MAAPQVLWNEKRKKKMVLLFLHPMLQLQPTNPIATLATNTIDLQVDEAFLNANYTCSGDVRSLSRHNRFKEPLDILHVIRSDSHTYASLLHMCLDMKALPDGELIHSRMIRKGFNADIFIGTKLVIMYANCGCLVDARRFLDEMPKRSVVTWTAMIAAYSRYGFTEEALKLFFQMQRTGVLPNEFTFASVLPACATLASLRHGKEIHEDIIRRGFESNVFVGSALVDMYAKCGSIEDARQVFDKMPERNVVSWNTMIVGYAQSGHLDQALKLFQIMPEQNVVSWNAMITGFSQDGDVDEVLKLFQKMPERNVVSWTAIIAGYSQNGCVDEALKLFQGMPERNVVSWTTIMAGYAQNWYANEALKFFQKMPERNVISWNAMIAGYVQNGHFEEALKFFLKMQVAQVKLNPVTFASVLPAYANLAALQQGKEIHEDIIRCGFDTNVFVGNALIDMYAKCGCVEEARQVFDNMPEQNVVSWNAIIAAYAMHGRGKEALHLFEQMQHAGTKPDHVSFVGVLSACSHAGLVEDGWRYFDRMTRDYDIIATMEHYCCMVDILGRAGRLDEAQQFINKMPIKLGPAVWGSLLGACRIHNNIELGEHVAERLFESDPENSLHYVLLSNIYAAAGRWGDKEKVRKMMNDRKVKKMPGHSWIEVNSKVYVFKAGDKSHPQAEKIYETLEKLSGLMKEDGYMPNTNFVLHDVEEEQKEHFLCHHSEKLAVAFGLLNTSPRTPIRIVKNLRVCGDCHSAIKFISKIVVRKIVVRDASRFHHFNDGQCSCGDYW